MAESNVRTILVGFAGALIVLGVFYWFIGIEDILDALSRADIGVVLLVVVGAFCWVAAWGLSLRAVLGVLGSPISSTKATLVFSGVLFANNVTPFGQAGGEPISGLLISRATDRNYETGLAAIASVDALNFVPSISLAIVGLGYLAMEFTFPGELRVAALTIVALALAVPVCGYVGWRNRYQLEEVVVDTVTPLVLFVRHRILRRQPRTDGAIERRIEGFFSAIERVATSPRGLTIALGMSTVGWLAQAACLWLSLYALGYAVSPVVVLVAIPIGAVAGVTPLPGGLGGIEVVLAAVIGTMAPTLTTAVIGAAVIIHRVAIYGLPTVVGGVVATVIANQ